jgi:hypothetical protein
MDASIADVTANAREGKWVEWEEEGAWRLVTGGDSALACIVHPTVS